MKPRRKGRPKSWHENVNLRLRTGAKAEMDGLLEHGEDRLDLIRHAIEKEVRLRKIRRAQKAAETTLPT